MPDLSNAKLAGTDITVADTRGVDISQASLDEGERSQSQTSHHWVSWSGRNI